VIRLTCEACGANEIEEIGNIFQCTYCGSRYWLSADNSVAKKKLTDTEIVSIIEESKRLHEEGKYAQELDILIKALENDEENPSIIVKLGRCYRCLNLPNKAMECYKRTLELNPYEGTAYTNMGTIHLLRQNYIEAAKCYEQGLSLIDKADFDYWVANANYAVAVARLGNPQKAEEMIRESESRGYKNGQAVRKMAGIEKRSWFSKIWSAFNIHS